MSRVYLLQKILRSTGKGKWLWLWEWRNVFWFWHPNLMVGWTSSTLVNKTLVLFWRHTRVESMQKLRKWNFGWWMRQKRDGFAWIVFTWTTGMVVGWLKATQWKMRCLGKSSWRGGHQSNSRLNWITGRWTPVNHHMLPWLGVFHKFQWKKKKKW